MDGPGCSATERWAAGRRSRWREVACRSDPPDLVTPWRQWRLARNSVCPLSSFPVLRCSEVRAGSLRDHGGRRLYGDERAACSVQSLAPYSVLLSASKRSRGCDTAAELCRVVGRWPWMSSIPTSVLARDTRGRRAGRQHATTSATRPLHPLTSPHVLISHITTASAKQRHTPDRFGTPWRHS